MSSFTPSPDHAGEFRTALGQFATGVVLVTTTTPRGPLAMTVNSFTSVSLDPPLILWCPAKVSARHDGFTNARYFAMHILGQHQQQIAAHFARNGEDFSAVDVIEGAHGVPLLADCLARFECQTESLTDAGDHTILLGRVLRVLQGEGAPLVFQDGKFGALAQPKG